VPKIPDPIDMGCGLLYPVRVTPFAMVCRFCYTRDFPTVLRERVYPAHAINITTAGTWEFRGRSGAASVEPGMVTMGERGDSYGCAHHHHRPNTDLVAALTGAALDPDVGPIFNKSILRIPELHRMLERAAVCESDEEFDSHVFQAFDVVSKASLATRRRNAVGSLRIQRIKRFIEHNATEAVTLGDMAAVVGVSPFVLVRQFKKATGTTPYAYLASCRAAEARTLLRKSPISVEEVAKRVGFKDAAYFARFFKQNTGVTPTEFRRAT
jgi:AraC-like DNA-binding protein